MKLHAIYINFTRFLFCFIEGLAIADFQFTPSKALTKFIQLVPAKLTLPELIHPKNKQENDKIIVNFRENFSDYSFTILVYSKVFPVFSFTKYIPGLSVDVWSIVFLIRLPFKTICPVILTTS